MEPVFERMWKGTRHGCYKRYMFSSNKVLEYYEWKKHKRNKEACNNIDPIPPQSQFKFYGKFFCGLPGGKPFALVSRVDPETGECPDEYEPCSRNTSDENTVCYLPEDHPTSCPITDLQIVE